MYGNRGKIFIAAVQLINIFYKGVVYVTEQGRYESF